MLLILLIGNESVMHIYRANHCNKIQLNSCKNCSKVIRKEIQNLD